MAYLKWGENPESFNIRRPPSITSLPNRTFILMPPSEPLLSEQASFAKHLFVQGYPLWNPDPVLLPRNLQGVGLRIGDVGSVDERGRFDVFFNILDSTPGSSDTQPTFPPIDQNDVRRGSDDISPCEVVSSPKTSWDVDEILKEESNGFTYVSSCSRNNSD